MRTDAQVGAGWPDLTSGIDAESRAGASADDGSADDASGTAAGTEAEADPETAAREIVLGKLTAQARTRQELATSLRQRNVPDDTAENVLNRMEEVGLVDDAAFASSWVTSRQRRRRLSKRALSRELTRKGVDREQVDTALEQVAPEDEYAAARDLARSKGAGLAGLDRTVQYRRLAGALARRGFNAEVSRQVISEVLSTGADEDEGESA